MNFEIIKENQNHTQNWSGGSTTEIFIYPKTGNFKKLDFDFRLSKATIEVEESDFSFLPNMNRILVLLDGKLELNHENHHQKTLNPLDFDEFKGDWKTKSKGIASDFNLIYSHHLSTELKIIRSIEDLHEFQSDSKSIFCFYVLKNRIRIKEEIVKKNELLVLYPPFFEQKPIFLAENTIVIGIEIKY